MAIRSNGQVIPPQALAETTPMATTSWWYGADGMNLVDRWATYGHIYRSQPVISGLIDKVADLTARLSLKAQDTSNPDAVQPDRDSDYAHLLANPCPYMDPYSFWVWWVTTYELYGEVYGYKIRDDSGAVVGIAPMHPTRTWIERKPDGSEWFNFTLGISSAGLLECGREDMILSRRYNPDTTMRGLSRLESLTRTVQNEDAIRTAISSTWQRGAMPFTALQLEGKPNETTMARFRAKVEELHAGPSKAGGLLLLPAGITPVPLQIDPLKMQLIESLKLTREEACIRLDFPPPALHILDNATFSNITEQMRSMYRDSMAPRLERIESMLDFDVRPEFYPDGGRYAKFDLDEVLRGDFETRADAIKNMVMNGVATPNEARSMFNMARSDDPNADVLYANQALQPLGTPVAGAQTAAPPSPSAPEPPPVPATRAIAGRIGRKVTAASTRDQRRDAYRDEFLAVLTDTLDSQRASVKRLEVGPWDVPLAAALAVTATAVAQSAGRTIAAKYQPDPEILDIDAETDSAARGINAATMTAVNSADDGEVEKAFDGRLGLLALTAMTLATRWMNEGELDAAARFKKAKTKTWNTGPNPRPSHSAMNGETVKIHDTFSNGANHPGSGDADESCNCNCSLSFGE